VKGVRGKITYPPRISPQILTTQRGFSLNQILKEIESIYKFEELVPIKSV